MILVVAPSPALDVTYLLDAVRLGEIHRPREVIRQAGGKGVNVARAVVALGGAVQVVAVLGGATGDAVVALAAADGIGVTTVPTPAPTRECISAIPDSGAPTEFYEPAAPVDDAVWDGIADAVAGCPCDWVVISGRIPPGSGARLAPMLAERRAAGARIAIDSSGPDLVELLDRVAPDLVKINRAEAAELADLPGTASLGELAAAVRARTRGAVVLTDGAAGALAVDGAGSWSALPDPEPGRFAIGSGDSFLAGLLVALRRGDGLREALSLASAAGSANTRRPGAARFAAAEVVAAAARIRIVEQRGVG